MNRHVSPVCPRCGQRKLMGGRQREYNARSSIDGKQICVDCKINEIAQVTVRN